jgi:hypothetical protein
MRVWDRDRREEVSSMTSAKRLMEIRRADAMTNATTVLFDAEERSLWWDHNPQVFEDIRR